MDYSQGESGRSGRVARAAWDHEFRGHSRDIQIFKIEQLSPEMPLGVELADTKENLDRLLETSDGPIKASLVTLEKEQVRIYHSDSK